MYNYQDAIANAAGLEASNESVLNRRNEQAYLNEIARQKRETKRAEQEHKSGWWKRMLGNMAGIGLGAAGMAIGGPLGGTLGGGLAGNVIGSALGAGLGGGLGGGLAEALGGSPQSAGLGMQIGGNAANQYRADQRQAEIDQFWKKALADKMGQQSPSYSYWTENSPQYDPDTLF